ncbi:hypothetical protein DID75_01760 [Candidatus Marinamargulisbacteria bacterium SCGC AG-410-N11]|nr:hypothetical protein DID75_01760 [Candidatus Marinamargulisbacteria bacterium SCGC AG-410-N11]
MIKINSLEDLIEITKKAIAIKGSYKFSRSFSVDKLNQIHSECFELLTDQPKSLEIQAYLAELNAHIFKNTDDDQVLENSLDILFLIKESQLAKSEIKMQLKIFKVLRTMIKPSKTQKDHFQETLIKEVSTFIFSEFHEVRQLLVIYYFDTNYNSNNNVLTFNDSILNDERFLIRLNEVIVNLILKGPKNYNSIDPQFPIIKYEDILVRFFNQVMNGQLGIESKLFKVRKRAISLAEKLFEFEYEKLPDMTKDTDRLYQEYYANIKISIARFFVKYGQKLSKEIVKILDDNQLTIETINEEIEIVSFLISNLKKVNDKKYYKVAQKEATNLQELSNKLNSKI